MVPTTGLSVAYLAFLSACTFGSALARDGASPASDALSCTHSVTAKVGDSCISLATANGLTVGQFLQINPSVRSCTLSAGSAYCVSTEPSTAATPPATKPAPTSSSSVTSAPVPPPSTPSSASVPTTPVSPSSSSSTGAAPSQGSAGLEPSPDGSDGICGGQYTCLGSVYGECCSVNGYCGNSTEYCSEGCNPLYGKCGVYAEPSAATTVTAFFTTTSILVSTVTTTTTAFQTVTAPALTVTVTTSHAAVPTTRPVQTPSPTFPGVVKNCSRWYLIRATDTCRRIALGYATTQAQITTWNPGFDCDDIEDMVGNYICVGVQVALGGPFGIV